MATHKELWNLFKLMLPAYSDIAKEYFQCGRDGIRIVLKSGVELIFIRHDDRNWSLETRKSFVENLERKQK